VIDLAPAAAWPSREQLQSREKDENQTHHMCRLLVSAFSEQC
jgi:hypothetical protein